MGNPCENSVACAGPTHVERRWLRYEPCPESGEWHHVLPVVISSTSPLIDLQTPGNITDEQTACPCPGCAS